MSLGMVTAPLFPLSAAGRDKAEVEHVSISAEYISELRMYRQNEFSSPQN